MERKEFPPSTETIHFTQHQIKIIQIWAEQPSISQAAQKLNLSEHTVQTHLKRMRNKLGVSRSFDVYRYMKSRQLF
jgi:DNA-binding CsgD family transcriptional regulator